jgi:[ribosomal protein S18]-alanine N-acetyltransferase
MAEAPDVQILSATPDQARALSHLHGQLFAKRWNTEDMRRLLEHPACLALAAVSSHAPAPIAFIIAQATADEAEILSIGVDTEFQGRGVGRALVEALIALARGKGARRLFLDVAESNAAALALYARLGFEQMGRRKAYYLHPDGRQEDALLMVRGV